jgi:hypothetical protein
MTVSIDFNSIKNSLTSTYRTVAAKTSEWLGRAIEVIQSGTEKALPYLQNKRIAVASLVAVNLILFRLGTVFHAFFNRYAPAYIRKNYWHSITLSWYIGTIAFGVAAFSHYAKLPLSPMVITGITVASISLELVAQDFLKSPKSRRNVI